MRYTTIIDISQCPELYRNKNTRLVYLHLVFKSGYHDHDRDLCRLSIRSIAADTGLSVSAARNALQQLTKWQLLSRTGDIWTVRKWVPEQTITTRSKSVRKQQADEAAAKRIQENEAREREAELERIRRENLAQQGRSSLDEYRDYLKQKAAAGDVEAMEQLKRRGWAE